MTPRTARELLEALAPLSPRAEGAELVLSAAAPAPLAARLAVLHTGVRALLTPGRPPWWGLLPATGRVAALDPDAPLPAGVACLSVGGDPRWDRLPPWAPLDMPELFAGDAAAVPATNRRRSTNYPDATFRKSAAAP